MQGKIRSNCCSEISFKNSFNIYKLLSLHFTGLVLLRMVTATVQRERQQQEQSNRTSDVLQHTPLLRSNRRGSPGRAPGANRSPRATPGPPQSASASATPPPEPQQREGERFPPAQHGSLAPSTHQSPSRDAAGPVLPSSSRPRWLGTSGQRKGGQGVRDPDLAKSPPFPFQLLQGGGTQAVRQRPCSHRAQRPVGASWIPAGCAALRAGTGRGGGGCVRQASTEATVQSWYSLAEGP